jgi:hypothetical protein
MGRRSGAAPLLFMNDATHIFSVRGRPVGFVPGRFGGALVAIERGYFPISATGYRSLAGHFGVTGEADPTAVSAEFLEALAVAQDRTRAVLLARLRRAPLPTGDRLGNFTGVCLDAEAALTEGFFAPDAERFTLWSGAFRLFHLIDADAHFQPVPSGPAWSAAGCAHALAVRRALLEFVRRLAAGELPAMPDGTHGAVRAYFELPPKSHGEPAFALPALSAELPLDLPPREEAEDETEPEEVEAEPAEVGEDDPAQMSLL